MLIRIDPASDRPLSEQIAASVRRALADGTLRPAGRLPAARSVAQALGINMHTVLRGYQQLKSEGLIDLRPGRGAIVARTVDPLKVQIHDTGRQLVTLARDAGLSDPEIVELVRDCLADTPASSVSASSSASPRSAGGV